MRYIMSLFLCTYLLSISIFANTLKELEKGLKRYDNGKLSLSIETKKIKGDDDRVLLKKYDVLRKNNEHSLILFRHKNEEGTVVLRSKQNLYIKAKSSSVPLRITPIQRLFGDVSIGDILELRFSDFYDQIASSQDKITLQAKNKNSTYHKVILYAKDGKLEYSELYSYSGKLLKKVHYIYDEDGIIRTFKFMTYKKQSIVKIKSFTPQKLSNRLFKKSNLPNIYGYAKNL